VYLPVDEADGTVDFFPSRNRDANAAKAFLHSAMKNRLPEVPDKNPNRAGLRADLTGIFLAAKPQAVHLHNLADRNDTRVGVAGHPTASDQ